MGEYMFKLIIFLLSTFMLLPQTAKAARLDEAINEVVKPISDAAIGVIFKKIQIIGVDVPLILIWLFTASAFFTIYFGFINFRLFVGVIC